MRKAKTKKSAAKRFKVTGTGKILRRHSHARHIMTKKPRKRVRKLVSAALVSRAVIASYVDGANSQVSIA